MADPLILPVALPQHLPLLPLVNQCLLPTALARVTVPSKWKRRSVSGTCDYITTSSPVASTAVPPLRVFVCLRPRSVALLKHLSQLNCKRDIYVAAVPVLTPQASGANQQVGPACLSDLPCKVMIALRRRAKLHTHWQQQQGRVPLFSPALYSQAEVDVEPVALDKLSSLGVAARVLQLTCLVKVCFPYPLPVMVFCRPSPPIVPTFTPVFTHLGPALSPSCLLEPEWGLAGGVGGRVPSEYQWGVRAAEPASDALRV